jgi:hypothetical protein
MASGKIVQASDSAESTNLPRSRNMASEKIVQASDSAESTNLSKICIKSASSRNMASGKIVQASNSAEKQQWVTEETFFLCPQLVLVPVGCLLYCQPGVTGIPPVSSGWGD